MAEIDKTVLKETKYIALVCLILSVLTQSVFLIIGKWDFTVLLGNVLSYLAGVLNFLIMGITVQKAVLKQPEEAKKLVKLSQTLRLWGLFAVALIGVLFPKVFSIFTVLIPLLFPSIAVFLKKLLIGERSKDKK